MAEDLPLEEIPLIHSLISNEPDDVVLNVLATSVQPPLDLALILAVCRATMTVAVRLMELGANCNAREANQITPLHSAIDTNSYDGVCLLLYYNADVHYCSDNMCPLFRAIYYKREQIVKVLLPYYFDHDIQGRIIYLLTDLESEGRLNWQFRLYVTLPNEYKWDEIYYYVIKVPGTSYLFKEIIRLMHPKQFVTLRVFLKDFLSICCYVPESFIDCFYRILYSPIGKKLINLYNDNLLTPIHDYLLYTTLSQALVARRVNKDILLQVFYVCLSEGLLICFEEYNNLYYYLGYKEELEALIMAGHVKNDTIMDSNQLSPVPAYICFHHTTLTHHKLYSYLTTTAIDHEVIDALKYFHFPLHVTWILMEKEWRTGAVIEALTKNSRIPSLTQLGRDFIRNRLMEKFVGKKPYQYVDIIKGLEVPQSVKDKLLFKTWCYSE